MTDATPVAHSQLSPPQLAGLTDAQRERLLGITCIGGPAEAWHGELPVQNVAAPLLGRSAGACNEVWYSADSCRSGTFSGIRFRVDDNVLYGVLDIEEGDYAGRTLPLQCASEDAYQRIFALLDRTGYPYLWRAWNYLANINSEQDGLERYRQFNIGRYDAFVASGRLARGNVPAACALGTTRGPLTIAFMAGRVAPIPIENPRQVSAYDYPPSYGPRSPTFSRAAFAHLPGQELLFISGTASIVGHQTLHLGDVAGQTRETLANIEALLREANTYAHGPQYSLTDLRLRTYIRHAQDQAVIQTIVENMIGAHAPVLYIQADICRSDLLVEIEATASHIIGNC